MIPSRSKSELKRMATLDPAKLVEKYHALQAENTRLRTALKYYADPDRYLIVEPEQNRRVIGILERDPGSTARTALEGK